MTKRTKATVRGALLTWARESAGFALDEAASKLDMEPDKLAGWEHEEDHPSIPQLRKMANLYKRPLAVFYLPEPPLAFQPMSDFRRLPEAGARRFSPALTLEIRHAHQRRELALELAEEIDIRPVAFTLACTLQTPTVEVGRQIRETLGISYELQSRWHDERVAFRCWQNAIEAAGVLVFQASRFDSAEASGFAYWADTLPFMVVNGKDVFSRRTFSLLHELAHLMLHQSGVSDLAAEGNRAPASERVEIFCNQVAADTLMPRAQFLAEAAIAARGPGQHVWTDDTIRALALTYSVSREAIVRRLLTLGRTSDDFYRQKRAQYAREFAVRREREQEKNKGKAIPRNMPRETVATFGRPFIRMVFDNYRADRISLSEVSGYLGVKARHLSEIERSAELP